MVSIVAFTHIHVIHTPWACKGKGWAGRGFEPLLELVMGSSGIVAVGSLYRLSQAIEWSASVVSNAMAQPRGRVCMALGVQGEEGGCEGSSSCCK